MNTNMSNFEEVVYGVFVCIDMHSASRQEEEKNGGEKEDTE